MAVCHNATFYDLSIFNMQCPADLKLCEIERKEERELLNRLCTSQHLDYYQKLFAFILLATLAWGYLQNLWAFLRRDDIDTVIAITKKLQKHGLDETESADFVKNGTLPSQPAGIQQVEIDSMIQQQKNAKRLNRWYAGQNILNCLVSSITFTVAVVFITQIETYKFKFWGPCDIRKLPTPSEGITHGLTSSKSVYCFDPDASVFWTGYLAIALILAFQAVFFLTLISRTPKFCFIHELASAYTPT